MISYSAIAGDMFLESEADVRHYRSIFDTLASAALSPKDSATYIADIMSNTPCGKVKHARG
ncbi:Scr1 family TA system antitoxin-like transcriptional regulator [Actinokineospora sp. 24-640]